MTWTDYVPRKTEEEDSPVKIAWKHQYQDSRSTLKRVELDLLQRPVTDLTTYKDANHNKTTKQKCEEKQLLGYFKRLTSKISH